MGFLSSKGTTRAIDRLKSGLSVLEDLSIADIATITINMADAHRNLPHKQYMEVQEIYDELQKEKKKMPFSLDDYMHEWAAITLLFNSVAPFELYCGSLAIAEDFNRMKHDPSLQEISITSFRSTTLHRYAALYKKDIKTDEVTNYNDSDDYDNDSDESEDRYNDIIGDYEYIRSHVLVDESGVSIAFDAELDVEINIYEDHDCTIVIDGEDYFGTWEHVKGVFYDFYDFDNDEIVVLRGLSKYSAKYLHDDLVICEDVPQITGISIVHLFNKI